MMMMMVMMMMIVMMMIVMMMIVMMMMMMMMMILVHLLPTTSFCITSIIISCFLITHINAYVRDTSNILACIPTTNIFIEAGMENGGVLVHCFGGMYVSLSSSSSLRLS